MRGDVERTEDLFSYVALADRVPSDHPLRSIRAFVDPILRELSPRFDAIYAKTGRPSIPPEQLLKALLLQVLYTVRSERMLCEQLEYNLLFRWFVGLGLNERAQRDWDRFIRERRAGRVGPSGRPVSDRMIEYDLKFLIAVFNWAVKSRDERGRPLLSSNPLKGLRLPKEKNPLRVVLSEEEYQALLKVSPRVDWRFRVALVIAHETGHRIGAVRQLRWSDIDLEGRIIRWRADHEKSGYEHRTPMTEEAVAALEEARSKSTEFGEAPVLPAAKDPSAGVSRWLLHNWWERAEQLAGLEPKRGRGWHSLRRKFASDLMDQPLKVLCELGGWKDIQTVLRCYQRADEGQLRHALTNRRRVRT